jgi:hypothetical protein
MVFECGEDRLSESANVQADRRLGAGAKSYSSVLLYSATATGCYYQSISALSMQLSLCVCLFCLWLCIY